MPIRAETHSSSMKRVVSNEQPHHSIATSSVTWKRVHSEIGADNQEARSERRKVAETVVANEQVVFFPLCVYGHTFLGILFTSSSIRGRGTTIFCVLDLDDPKKRLALKMSWQDFERVADQDAVTKRLEEHKPHPNVIMPNLGYRVLIGL